MLYFKGKGNFFTQQHVPEFQVHKDSSSKSKPLPGGWSNVGPSGAGKQIPSGFPLNPGRWGSCFHYNALSPSLLSHSNSCIDSADLFNSCLTIANSRAGVGSMAAWAWTREIHLFLWPLPDVGGMWPTWDPPLHGHLWSCFAPKRSQVSFPLSLKDLWPVRSTLLFPAKEYFGGFLFLSHQ